MVAALATAAVLPPLLLAAGQATAWARAALMRMTALTRSSAPTANAATKGVYELATALNIPFYMYIDWSLMSLDIARQHRNAGCL